MKKLLIAVACATIGLSSCGMDSNQNTDTPPSKNPNVSTTTGSKSVVASGTVVSLNYTLHQDKADGKVLESTVESVAKSEGLYQTGGRYQPFQVLVGAVPAQVIPGFEKGLLGMKVGEKKVIEVSPKDGYGEDTIVRPVSKYEIAPSFTVTLDKSKFQDKVTEKVSKAMLGEDGKTVTVGKTLNGANGMTAVVKNIDDDTVTLEIDNKAHPFYGKKFVVGAKANQEGMEWTIKSINGTGATFDIVNTKSPFYGKNFVVGASAQIPGATQSGTIVIESMSGDTISVKMPNEHPLHGKTLFFEVEIVDIK